MAKKVDDILSILGEFEKKALGEAEVTPKSDAKDKVTPKSDAKDEEREIAKKKLAKKKADAKKKAAHKKLPEHPWDERIDLYEPTFKDGYELRGPGGSLVSMESIKDAYESGENVHLVGASGTGKTTIARHLLDELNAPVRDENIRIFRANLKAGKEDIYEGLKDIPYKVCHYSCHEATRTEELIGSVTLKIAPDGTRAPEEVYGAVTTAWVEGQTLLLEEFDLAAPGVLGELHLFLDGKSEETTLYLNGPRTIRKHPEFRCIGTSNTKGAGEAAMEFAGTQPLNSAFMNRFNYTVEVGWLQEAAEINLLVEVTGVDKTLAAKLVRIATKVRKAYDEEQVDSPISTRQLLSWCRECVRKIKRIEDKGSSVTDIWKNIGIPAAVPTVLNGIADTTSRDSVWDVIKIH